LLCKNIIVLKSKEGKMGSNMAESSGEVYGSKGAVLPMMMKCSNPTISCKIFC
jgi:hypothetical protein